MEGWQMIRLAFAFSVASVAPAVAQPFDVIATMSTDAYQAEVSAWNSARGLGDFDMTGLEDSDTIVFTPYSGEPATRHTVELVGLRDPATDACTWGWASDTLAHLSREASVAVKDFGTGRDLDELSTGQMTLDYQDCLDRMAAATMIGDLDLIVALIHDDLTYFFGFKDIEGGS